MSAADAGPIERLYEKPMAAKRTGAVYNAFSYPTKIDAEAIAIFIATHTKPGATILDVFGGSGATGIAARLCDRPTDRMREMAQQAGIDPEWGPRDTIVYELSPLAALLAKVMSDPPDADKFAIAANALVDAVESRWGWAYEAVSPRRRDREDPVCRLVGGTQDTVL